MCSISLVPRLLKQGRGERETGTHSALDLSLITPTCRWKRVIWTYVIINFGNIVLSWHCGKLIGNILLKLAPACESFFLII